MESSKLSTNQDTAQLAITYKEPLLQHLTCQYLGISSLEFSASRSISIKKALEYSTPVIFSFTKKGEGHSIPSEDHWDREKKEEDIIWRSVCWNKQSYSRQRLACVQCLDLHSIFPPTTRRSVRDSKWPLQSPQAGWGCSTLQGHHLRCSQWSRAVDRHKAIQVLGSPSQNICPPEAA